jgi:hypothetical protein
LPDVRTRPSSEAALLVVGATCIVVGTVTDTELVLTAEAQRRGGVP